MQIGTLLWWCVLDEFNSLLNIAFEALDGNIKQFFLLLRSTSKDVDSLRGSICLYLSVSYLDSRAIIWACPYP